MENKQIINQLYHHNNSILINLNKLIKVIKANTIVKLEFENTNPITETFESNEMANKYFDYFINAVCMADPLIGRIVFDKIPNNPLEEDDENEIFYPSNKLEDMETIEYGNQRN